VEGSYEAARLRTLNDKGHHDPPRGVNEEISSWWPARLGRGGRAAGPHRLVRPWGQERVHQLNGRAAGRRESPFRSQLEHQRRDEDLGTPERGEGSGAVDKRSDDFRRGKAPWPTPGGDERTTAPPRIGWGRDGAACPNPAVTTRREEFCRRVARDPRRQRGSWRHSRQRTSRSQSVVAATDRCSSNRPGRTATPGTGPPRPPAPRGGAGGRVRRSVPRHRCRPPPTTGNKHDPAGGPALPKGNGQRLPGNARRAVPGGPPARYPSVIDLLEHDRGHAGSP